MMTAVELAGLDGQNPLAFFAALGLLRILDDHAQATGRERPRLAFVEGGQQMPVLSSAFATLNEIVSVVLEDASKRATDPLLSLAYDDDGNRVSADAPEAIGDLKPPPALAKAALLEAAGRDRRAADLGAAFFSELVQDNNGNTKPTALHFTAGQQLFLKMVNDLRRGITAADIVEALRGPWTGESKLPSLSWDATVASQYALRAGNPSNEKRGSIPAANWLGVVGLSFFPVAAVRGRLVTTGVVGGWKNSVLSWPLWSAPTSARTIASLLRLDARRFSMRDRQAMGLSQIMTARILRSEQGGYGSFSPPSVALPW
jgi:hypothetical protein